MSKSSGNITIKVSRDNFNFLKEVATNKNMPLDAVAAWLLDDGISSYRFLKNGSLNNNTNSKKLNNVQKRAVTKKSSGKICRKCGQIKSRSEFSEGANFCNDCMNKTTNESKVKYKKCYKCGKTKSIDQFYIKKSNADGLHSYCKQCMSLYLKQRRITKTKKNNLSNNNSNNIIKDSSNWKRNLILEKIERVKDKS